MKVLLAIPHQRERERLQKVVGTHGHEVVEEGDKAIEPALAHVFDSDVAVVSYRDGAVRSVRRAPSDRRPYIIALFPTMDGRAIQAALQEGADDILVMRACPEEVLARVEMPQRIEAWNSGDGLSRIQDLMIWNDAPRLLSQEVGEMFGLFMSEQPHMGEIPDLASKIVVTCPDDGSEVQLLIGMTTSSGNKLAELVFGGPVVPAVLSDCLREIANSLGGVFKRSAMAEGTTLTLGLPQDCQATEILVGEQIWVAETDGIAIQIGLSMASNQVQRVRASQLQPGMVLKHEVRNAAGQLMVAAGTAITDRTAERLVELCGANALFDVVEPSTVEGGLRAANG